MPVFWIGSILAAAKEAFHYITSAVRSSISSEVTSTIIKPIGEYLSNVEISETYGLYEESVASWQRIHNIPNSAFISEEFSVISPYDWRRQHIMKMRIQGINLETGEEVDTWITVESQQPLTKEEWLNLGQEAVIDSPFGYKYQVDYVAEYEYYYKAK